MKSKTTTKGKAKKRKPTRTAPGRYIIYRDHTWDATYETMDLAKENARVGDTILKVTEFFQVNTVTKYTKIPINAY